MTFRSGLLLGMALVALLWLALASFPREPRVTWLKPASVWARNDTLFVETALGVYVVAPNWRNCAGRDRP